MNYMSYKDDDSQLGCIGTGIVALVACIFLYNPPNSYSELALKAGWELIRGVGRLFILLLVFSICYILFFRDE